MKDLGMNARQMSLQSLMDAMDEDDTKRIPGLTIEIITGGKGEPEGDESGLGAGDESDQMGLPASGDLPMGNDTASMFEELLRKKKAARGF